MLHVLYLESDGFYMLPGPNLTMSNGLPPNRQQTIAWTNGKPVGDTYLQGLASIS